MTRQPAYLMLTIAIMGALYFKVEGYHRMMDGRESS